MNSAGPSTGSSTSADDNATDLESVDGTVFTKDAAIHRLSQLKNLMDEAQSRGDEKTVGELLREWKETTNAIGNQLPSQSEGGGSGGRRTGRRSASGSGAGSSWWGGSRGNGTGFRGLGGFARRGDESEEKGESSHGAGSQNSAAAGQSSGNGDESGPPPTPGGTNTASGTNNAAGETNGTNGPAIPGGAGRFYEQQDTAGPPETFESMLGGENSRFFGRLGPNKLHKDRTKRATVSDADTDDEEVEEREPSRFSRRRRRSGDAPGTSDTDEGVTSSEDERDTRPDPVPEGTPVPVAEGTPVPVGTPTATTDDNRSTLRSLWDSARSVLTGAATTPASATPSTTVTNATDPEKGPIFSVLHYSDENTNLMERGKMAILRDQFGDMAPYYMTRLGIGGAKPNPLAELLSLQAQTNSFTGMPSWGSQT
ncbi:hypothetical protein IAT38_005430 [Cryptococcus sp. DSM 104549]